MKSSTFCIQKLKNQQLSRRLILTLRAIMVEKPQRREVIMDLKASNLFKTSINARRLWRKCKRCRNDRSWSRIMSLAMKKKCDIKRLQSLISISLHRKMNRWFNKRQIAKINLMIDFLDSLILLQFFEFTNPIIIWRRCCY